MVRDIQPHRPAPHYDARALCEAGIRVIATEAAAVKALESRIDDRFALACRILMECRGRVVVTGMGTSGHIAGKSAATLASTGTPDTAPIKIGAPAIDYATGTMGAYA